MVALKYDPNEERLYTLEEYLEFENASETKHEFFDGRILPVYRDFDCRAMAGASSNHNTITLNIGSSLRNQLRGQPCRPWAQDMRVRISAEGQHAYPDVLVACRPFEWDETATLDTLLNPRVIVEVLSRTTEAFDRGEKFARYRLLPSLTDYILVAQDARNIDHFRRQMDGRWLLETSGNNEDTVIIESIACQLRVEEVYEDVEFPLLKFTSSKVKA